MKAEFSLLKVRILIVTVAMLVFGAPLAADSITTKTFNKLTEAQEMMAQDNIEAAIEELELLLEGGSRSIVRSSINSSNAWVCRNERRAFRGGHRTS